MTIKTTESQKRNTNMAEFDGKRSSITSITKKQKENQAVVNTVAYITAEKKISLILQSKTGDL